MRTTITTALITSSLLLPMSAGAHTNHCQDTRLGDQMQSLKQHFKDYRRALADQDWAEMQAQRQAMQTLTHAAADEQPLKLHDLPAEQHAEMLQRYRQGLDRLNRQFMQLAQAEQAQDAATATELVGRIGQHSKQSHDSMRKDCD